MEAKEGPEGPEGREGDCEVKGDELITQMSETIRWLVCPLF
jgi:hypothetical protein